MTSRPWMPLYIGDYHRDTRHLTTLQHGAYMLLIMHYWAHGSLPTDEASLKRITGVMGPGSHNQWRSICLAIAPFFDKDWRHKRIDAELEKANNISAKRAFAGFRGGSISRGKTNGMRFESQAFAKQTGTPSHPRSYASTSLDSETEPVPPQEVGEKEDGKIQMASPYLAAKIKSKYFGPER